MKKLKDVKLTQMTKTSGWAAKVGPEVLEEVLKDLPKITDKRLIVGIDGADDCAVYQITDDICLVNTLDFFTPIVDDPYTFGRIAAANSLSDVYAMGTEPKLAMNIVCFPNCLEPEVLKQILHGAHDKCDEAGCLVIGGHTVQDDEPKFGLSVSAFIHPDKILKNNTPNVGDVLILTKPIGVGVMNTALKGGLIEENSDSYKKLVLSMETLNKFGFEAIKDLKVSACTDITGFGLLGHIKEMVLQKDVSCILDVDKVPYFEEAMSFAEMGLVPEGTYANKKYCKGLVDLGSVDSVVIDLLFDPQTSGGLLISLPEEEAKKAMENLKNSKLPAAIVGRIVEEEIRKLF